MPLREAAGLLLRGRQAELLLDPLGQIEQLHVPAERAGAAAEAAGTLLDAHKREKTLNRVRLLNGREVLPLEVLQQRLGSGVLVGELAHHDRNVATTGELASSVASLAGDDLVLAVLG